MRILAIETSCDETAIAIAEFFGPKLKPKIKVWSHIIASQIKTHQKFGGVVPNLARREHEKNLPKMLLQSLKHIKNTDAKQKKQDKKLQTIKTLLEREPELYTILIKKILPLPTPYIDAIAVTYGPGLAPALWVGVNFARALAVLWDKPLIPTNHMAGHIYSAFLQKSGVDSKFEIQNSKFPAIALLVSGGHTELVLMKKHGDYKILGQTRDDAVGEAFDKVARLLGFPYPGGPIISKLAEKGDPMRHPLPKPMINSGDYDFSFSGLKTAVLYLLRDNKKIKKEDLAASFEKSAIDVLIKKTIRAVKEYKVKILLLGGGVSANKELRRRLQESIQKETPDVTCHMSPVALSGDNALMIAIAAYFTGKKKAPTEIGADANLVLG